MCKQIILTTITAVLLAGCESTGMMHMHDQAPDSHITVLADQVQWKPAPASLPPGAQAALLEGDPSKPGLFTMRISMPDGYRIPPHSHPGVERVTVLSGSFYLGQGDRFDESAGKLMPAGAYTSMPPGMHHYAWAKGPTVVQISTIGPWGITYINPADDPRNAPK